jgi:hypothetical protein
MKTIKRYGVSMGDLSADESFKSSAMAKRPVPERFLETPGRLRLQRMTRIMGLFSFVVTVLVIVSIFLMILFPTMVSGETGDVLMQILLGLFIVNHFGLFLEMAGDSGGKNWFTKGVVCMWLNILGIFFILVVMEIFGTVFS